MYLKSLVLKGFKSFADRSVLTLEPGITAIVGPNGSGKSNISDAVLWVLGERNAKHLRGQAMEDVIFAGSSARKSVGMAEVELVLDNSDGTLPIEYNEVSVARRIYRTGESEYLINGSIARRMDVLDILHDTGLGTGTHSIISQGSLDAVLQSKPEDRRAIIEEAAGVLKHKQRKAKSERKLAAMDAHLARVKDVAGEVRRQLGPLERKAKKAREHQELSQQLDRLSLDLAVDDLRSLQVLWNEACDNEKRLEADLEQRRGAIERAEKEAEALAERIRRESVDAGKLAEKHRLASSAVERFDGVTLLLHEKKRAAQDDEARLRVTLEANAAKREAAKNEVEQARAQLTEVREQRARAEARIAELSAAQAENAQTRKALERRADELSSRQRQASKEQEHARSQLSETQEALASGLAHVRLIEGHGKELLLQLERASAQATACSEKLAECEKKLAELKDEESAARCAVADAMAKRDGARTDCDALRDEASVLSAQVKALEERERAEGDAGPIIAQLLDRAEELGGVSMLSHCMRVQPEYEKLVETLLGDEVSALLVKDSEAVRSVRRCMDECDANASIVVVDKSGASSGLASGPVVEGGGRRALVDALTCDDGCKDAVFALLGDVVVCETLQDALKAAAECRQQARFVTLEGEVVCSSGKAVLGKSSSNQEEGVFARVRRLSDLREKLAETQGRLQNAQNDVEKAEALLRDAQGDSLKLSQQLAEHRGKTESARGEAKSVEEKLSSVRRELEQMQQRKEDAERTVSQARPSVEALEEKLASLAKETSEGAEELERVQGDVVPLRKEAARLRDELADAKLRKATLSERETYTDRIVIAREEDLKQFDASDARARTQLEGKTLAQERIGPLLACMEELANSARKHAQRLEERSSAAQDASAGLHAATDKARTAAREAHESFDASNARLSEARVEKGRLEVQVETAVKIVVEECGAPLERALELPKLEDRQAASQQADKLRRRIKAMGTVNPDAATEFEQLKERYDYLASQLGDLEGARRTLSKIVRVIDARMKDDFARTFEAVDRNFQEVFALLFPGGSAHLSLVDPDDLENTGVEVTAQPRGKRITKMMLMSGGEKSLTALALLFAVYRIRTTPFYILDEVEAALDDSNLRRLTAYLDTLRNETQLIMITHQRRTMEMSDVLFGVSMQSDGVTKVVSQKLDRALQYAED